MGGLPSSKFKVVFASLCYVGYQLLLVLCRHRHRQPLGMLSPPDAEAELWWETPTHGFPVLRPTHLIGVFHQYLDRIWNELNGSLRWRMICEHQTLMMWFRCMKYQSQILGVEGLKGWMMLNGFGRAPTVGHSRTMGETVSSHLTLDPRTRGVGSFPRWDAATKWGNRVYKVEW